MKTLFLILLNIAISATAGSLHIRIQVYWAKVDGQDRGIIYLYTETRQDVVSKLTSRFFGISVFQTWRRCFEPGTHPDQIYSPSTAPTFRSERWPSSFVSKSDGEDADVPYGICEDGATGKGGSPCVS